MYGDSHASTSERIDLSLNGLGEKKLSFPKEGNAAEVHETILAAFPAFLIPMPSNGFSVGYLQTINLLKLTLVWSLSQGLVIRRTTGLESANLRTKNTQKHERKPAKILEL